MPSFFAFCPEKHDCRGGAVAQRTEPLERILAVVKIVDSTYLDDRHSVLPDSFRGAIVELQAFRAPPGFNPQATEWCVVSVDPLVRVPHEEQVVRAAGYHRSKQRQLIGSEILDFI